MRIDSEQRRRNGRLAWIIAVGVLAVVAVAWSLLPWEWSPVDDPSQVLTLRGEIEQYGPIGGPLHGMWSLAVGDYAGGVFRPTAWVYPKLMYLLPVGPAHAVRLLMVIVAIVAPLVYLYRQGAHWPRLVMSALLLLAASHALYVGLLLLSVQEVGGVALVALGLLSRRDSVRITLWTAAALFKGPFSWILIGNAVALWRSGQRRHALVSGALGVATLVINFWWSRSGTYSEGYGIQLWRMWANAERLIEGPNVIVLVMILWWLGATQTRLLRRPDWPIFAIGWAGYTLTMLPWAVTAYYMGPIAYLFGLLAVTMLVDPDEIHLPQVLAALLVPFLLSTWLVRNSLEFVFNTNNLMIQARTCLSTLDSPNVAVGGTWTYATSYEGPIRMGETVKLRDPTWTGVVTADESGTLITDPATTHYMTVGGFALPSGREATPVCELPYVTLYELGARQ